MSNPATMMFAPRTFEGPFAMIGWTCIKCRCCIQLTPPKDTVATIDTLKCPVCSTIGFYSQEAWADMQGSKDQV